MKIDLKKDRIRKGQKVDLAQLRTSVDPLYRSTSPYDEILADHVKLIVSHIVINALAELKPKFPKVPEEVIWPLEAIKRDLIAEAAKLAIEKS